MKGTRQQQYMNVCLSTDQPYHHSLVPHVSSSVQAGHAVMGPDVDVSRAVLHKVLYHMQVAFLTGEVQWGGTHSCLVVHAPVLQHISTTKVPEIKLLVLSNALQCLKHAVRVWAVVKLKLVNTRLHQSEIIYQLGTMQHKGNTEITGLQHRSKQGQVQSQNEAHQCVLYKSV